VNKSASKACNRTKDTLTKHLWAVPKANQYASLKLTLAIIWLCSGVPQIEVTFEVDANGILSVSAEDKGTGKAEKITITNDKGRLTQEEIERMVAEAEEFAEEDKKIKERIDARNHLETYVYNMKNTISDSDKLGDKIGEDDKESIEAAIKETLEWMDDNQSAEKEEYEEKLKEVEGVCNPIISKLYQAAGPGAAGADEDEESDHDEL
jgi:heat shock protein 5